MKVIMQSGVTWWLSQRPDNPVFRLRNQTRPLHSIPWHALKHLPQFAYFWHTLMPCTVLLNTPVNFLSSSMYSLTFCVRVMSPECHHWKPAVQAASVMLRTSPSTASHRPASHVHFSYTARNFENAPSLPAGHRPAARADPAERSHYVVISRDGRKLVIRVRIMLP